MKISLKLRTKMHVCIHLATRLKKLCIKTFFECSDGRYWKPGVVDCADRVVAFFEVN